MGRYGYMVNGKYVYKACRKNKPYCTYSYTCIRTRSVAEAGIATRTESSTTYTSTTWESRMSTYMRATTEKSYDECPYRFETSKLQTLTKGITATNYCECDCCNDNCCNETIIAAEKEHINTQTKQYRRYIDEEEEEYTTTTSSKYTETLTSTWSVTETYSKSTNKNSIFSTSYFSPEGKKRLKSTYMCYTVSTSGTSYVITNMNESTDELISKTYTMYQSSEWTYSEKSTRNTTSDYNTVSFERTVYDYNNEPVSELKITELATNTMSNSSSSEITFHNTASSSVEFFMYGISILTSSSEYEVTSKSIYNTTLTKTNSWYSSISRYIPYVSTSINTIGKIQVCECNENNDCCCNH